MPRAKSRRAGAARRQRFCRAGWCSPPRHAHAGGICGGLVQPAAATEFNSRRVEPSPRNLAIPCLGVGVLNICFG